MTVTIEEKDVAFCAMQSSVKHPPVYRANEMKNSPYFGVKYLRYQIIKNEQFGTLVG
jgi:hypothetical protein